MNNRILYPQPIQPIQPKPLNQPVKGQNENTHGTAPSNSFQNVLNDQLRTIKFSHHARQRLQARKISLSGAELKRLEEGVAKAAQKGARDSLVLMDKLALVVSVKNRTVITAVDETSLKENVFTNIDSAVIV
ncbi:MAG: TIGR02530 family flagellar biosynthesis protein [Bacillota bacterium]|jgi:flagellar operon protein